MTAVHEPIALDTFARDWADWHQRHETRLADPRGFLAITSLHWLTTEPQRFTDADDLVVDGTVVRGRYAFGAIAERGGVDAHWRDAVLEVARRGGRRPTRRTRRGSSTGSTCRSTNPAR
jgi:hypothetical protein